MAKNRNEQDEQNKGKSENKKGFWLRLGSKVLKGTVKVTAWTATNLAKASINVIKFAANVVVSEVKGIANDVIDGNYGKAALKTGVLVGTAVATYYGAPFIKSAAAGVVKGILSPTVASIVVKAGQVLIPKVISTTAIVAGSSKLAKETATLGYNLYYGNSNAKANTAETPSEEANEQEECLDEDLEVDIDDNDNGNGNDAVMEIDHSEEDMEMNEVMDTELEDVDLSEKGQPKLMVVDFETKRHKSEVYMQKDLDKGIDISAEERQRMIQMLSRSM